MGLKINENSIAKLLTLLIESKDFHLDALRKIYGDSIEYVLVEDEYTVKLGNSTSKFWNKFKNDKKKFADFKWENRKIKT